MQDPSDARPARQGLPIAPLVVLLALTAVLVTAQRLRVGEERALEQATADAATAVASELRARSLEEARVLEGFARRWERSGLPSPEAWELEAREILETLQDLQALEWVSPSFRVERIVPLAGNEQALGLDLGFEERRREALERARDSGRIVATQPVELVQGGLGILVFVPLYPKEQLAGFVLGVYRVDETLSGLLRNFAHGFAIRVHGPGGPVWSRDLEPADLAPVERVPLEALGVVWEAEVTPGPEVADVYRTPLPLLVAGGGGLLAILLGYALEFARQARVQARRWAEEVKLRERAEESERGARDELVAVANSFPDHVWSGVVLPSGLMEIRYYSAVSGKIGGRPMEYFRDDPPNWIDAIHEDDREGVREAYAAVLEQHRERIDVEYRIVRPGGEVRWVRDRVRSAPTEGGLRLDGVISDITDARKAEAERRALEGRLQQAQKLESLGVLAGGVAHDFNNLLVGVLGHARLMQDDLPPGSPLLANLASIERAARRAAELCRQMLAYAGRGSRVAEPLDLAEVVLEIGGLLDASISKKATLAYDFAAGLPLIEADAGQMRQLAMNLITNASEAIEDDTGRIGISLHRVLVAEGEVSGFELGEPLRPGPYLELSVHDTGCGMDEETLERIFEPFFTTRLEGRGLGLAAVLGIVRAHRGGVRVASEPGRGTKLTILLPVAEGSVRPARKRAEPEEAWRGSGTVLLVDDEEVAREVGELVLTRAGFKVLIACDGVDALGVLRRHRDEVRCVLLDLTMPRMDGRESFDGLRRLRPDVPVILCSGYPAGDARERFAGLDLAGFVEKPYTPEGMLSALRRALGDEDPVS